MKGFCAALQKSPRVESQEETDVRLQPWVIFHRQSPMASKSNLTGFDNHKLRILPTLDQELFLLWSFQPPIY